MERINLVTEKGKESRFLCYESPNVFVIDFQQDVIATSQQTTVQAAGGKTFSDYLDDGWF